MENNTAKSIMVSKNCEFCEIEFFVHRYRKNKARFCSYSCRSKQNWKLGVTKKPPTMFGRTNPIWKEEPSYRAIHIWMNTNFPRKGKCEFCTEERKTAWANKSNNYLREKKDWFELCYPCHKRYDLNKILC